MDSADVKVQLDDSMEFYSATLAELDSNSNAYYATGPIDLPQFPKYVAKNFEDYIGRTYQWSNQRPNFAKFTFGSKKQPGIKLHIPENSTPVDYLRLLLTDDLLDLFVKMSNKQARQSVQKSNSFMLPVLSRSENFTPFSKSDIEQFLGLTLLMGVVQKPSIGSYWSTSPAIYTPVFGQVMRRKKFRQLLSCLHLVDEATADKRDKLYAVRPMVDSFRNQMRKLYYPEQNLWISESEAPSTPASTSGKRQHGVSSSGGGGMSKSTRQQTDVKMYTLCESSSSLVYDVYVSAWTDEASRAGETTSEAMEACERLTSEVLMNGHTLYVDESMKWSTWDVGVAEWYLENRTHVTGRLGKRQAQTQARNRSRSRGRNAQDGGSSTTDGEGDGGTSAWEIEERAVEDNEVSRQTCLDGRVEVSKWRDKEKQRDVLFVSTETSADMIETTNASGERRRKPHALVKYKAEKRGGAESSDMRISQHSVLRKSVSWSRGLILTLFDIYLFNAFVLHRKVEKQRLSFLDFKLQVICSLCRIVSSGSKAAASWSVDLTYSPSTFHAPVSINSGRIRVQRHCILCKNKTTYKCGTCSNGPALCMVTSRNCFLIYHNRVDPPPPSPSCSSSVNAPMRGRQRQMLAERAPKRHLDCLEVSDWNSSESDQEAVCLTRYDFAAPSLTSTRHSNVSNRLNQFEDDASATFPRYSHSHSIRSIKSSISSAAAMQASSSRADSTLLFDSYTSDAQVLTTSSRF